MWVSGAHGRARRSGHRRGSRPPSQARALASPRRGRGGRARPRRRPGPALGLVLAFGSDEPGVVDGLSLLVGDAVLIAVILLFARRGTRLSPATLGIRRTPFWPAVGWSCAFFIGTIALMALWGLLVGAPGEEGGGSAGGPPARGRRRDRAVRRRGRRADRGGDRLPRLPVRGAHHAGAGRGPPRSSPRCCSAPPTSRRRPRRCSRRSRCFGFAACLLFWFTGSLLPCIAVHAFNNALVMGNLAGWSWQIPLVVVGAVAVSVLLLLPFARERAPQRAVSPNHPWRHS